MARATPEIGSASMARRGAAGHSQGRACSKCRQRELEALIESDLVEDVVGLTTGAVGEDEELEIAAALLDASGEAELDQLLGRVVRRAAQGARRQAGRGQRFLKSGAERKLVGIGRAVARRALPRARRATGGAIGRIAARAGRTFGLELETLSPADRDYEAARRLVRFTAAATDAAVAHADRGAPAAQALRSGVVAAARRHAPGLLQSEAGHSPEAEASGLESGFWRMRPPIRFQARRQICWAAAVSSWTMITPGVRKLRTPQEAIDFFRPLGVVTRTDRLASVKGLKALMAEFRLRIERLTGGGSLNVANLAPKLRKSHVLLAFKLPRTEVLHMVVVYGVDLFHVCYMDPAIDPGDPRLHPERKNRVCQRIDNLPPEFGTNVFWLLWRA